MSVCVDPRLSPAQIADLTNDLATWARRRYVRQTAAQAFLLACGANFLSLTAERIKPYSEWFNEANAQCYAILRQLGLYRRSAAPKLTFNARMRCDPRCWNATGPDCSCACGGINHATGHPMIGLVGVA